MSNHLELKPPVQMICYQKMWHAIYRILQNNEKMQEVMTKADKKQFIKLQMKLLDESIWERGITNDYNYNKYILLVYISSCRWRNLHLNFMLAIISVTRQRDFPFLF